MLLSIRNSLDSASTYHSFRDFDISLFDSLHAIIIIVLLQPLGQRANVWQQYRTDAASANMDQ